MTNKSHIEKLDKKIEMVGMTRKNITPDDVETLLIKDGLIKLSSSLKNNCGYMYENRIGWLCFTRKDKGKDGTNII